MLKMQEEAFWYSLDVEIGEELEMGPTPPSVQLEKAGRWVPWGLAIELAEEGPPLSPLGPGQLEVDSAKQAPEDGAAVEDATEE